MKNGVLIIGSVPPPIGGVTIHVHRLLNALRDAGINYDFHPVSIAVMRYLANNRRYYKVVHIHSSNPLARFVITLWCRFLGLKCINTIHGDLNRFKNKFKNYLDRLSVRFSATPILLNQKSFNVAKQLNSNTQIISSFLPPIIEEEYLDQQFEKKILELKQKGIFVFCTNAYNFSIDKNGQEIYGIIEIIDVIKKCPQFGLVLSDPSGAYSQKIKEDNIELNDRLLVVAGPHSFYKVLSLCDGSIRNTSTDGDSLSVKESLSLLKPTLVTDVVSRPANVLLYKRGGLSDFLSKINSESLRALDFKNDDLDGTQKLLDLYAQYLSS
jgi:glycosyltransferase involved in cell wall biosynthesis